MSLNYLLKRLLATLLTLWLVSLVVFGITQVLPGNAAQMILGEFATPEALEALEKRLGLDRPVWLQYARWAGGILVGDWGTSTGTSLPVFGQVVENLGRSMVLAGIALFVVTLLAVPLGVMAAVRRGGVVDAGVSVFSYLGVSLPEFVTATLLVVFLARPEIGLFPAGGYAPLSAGLWPFLSHLILPVSALTLILMAHISRQTRSEMVDVLGAEFVRTATLKGLSRRQVLIKHALRNAMLPTATVIALDVGYLIGGIVVVEEVFAFPGLGRLLLFAIQNRDLPLLQGAAVTMAGVYALANLAADLAYAWLDRRIQYD